jgi:hypothetical protein
MEGPAGAAAEEGDPPPANRETRSRINSLEDAGAQPPRGVERRDAFRLDHPLHHVPQGCHFGFAVRVNTTGSSGYQYDQTDGADGDSSSTWNPCGTRTRTYSPAAGLGLARQPGIARRRGAGVGIVAATGPPTSGR